MDGLVSASHDVGQPRPLVIGLVNNMSVSGMAAACVTISPRP